jgi:hypothetical protein
MEANRPGKAVGAKLARALIEQFAGVRAADLEALHPPGSRHQLFRLSDGRVLDLFFKSARLYPSQEEYQTDRRSIG